MNSLICPYCNKTIDLYGKGGGRKAAKDMNITFLGELPMEPDVIKWCDEGTIFKAIGNNRIFSSGVKNIIETIEKYTESKMK